MDQHYAAIRASIIDGIALTPRFRERNLARLHQALEAKRGSLLRILGEQQAGSGSGATLQYLLTLDAVHEFHASVEPVACLKEEYKVANSVNQDDLSTPYGYAYIEAANDDTIYSTVVPVAAAIAAGNCVLVRTPAKSTNISSVVKDLLSDSLSPEIFSFVTMDPFDEDFQKRYRAPLLVQYAAKMPPERFEGTALTPVIVDRTADVKKAAQDCVHARFGLGSQSPYAPDIILVNEFCLEAFTSAASETALKYLGGETSRISAHRNNRDAKSNDHFDVPKHLDQNGTILVSGSNGGIMVVHTRSADLLTHKTNVPLLLILPISSLDDAIDVLANSSSRFLALYVYAAPRFAKYLCQFTRAEVMLVNHMSPELLVGPAAPAQHKTLIHPRFSPNMFSWSTTVLVEPHLRSKVLLSFLQPDQHHAYDANLEAILHKPLVRTKEAFGPAVGFFEQGLFVGIGAVGTALITAFAIGAVYGIPALRARTR